MDGNLVAFGNEVGSRAIAQEWAKVHRLLAPWMRSDWSVARVQCFFEDEYRDTLAANSIDGMHYPAHRAPQLGGNGLTTATELRKPISWAGDKVRDVAPEVTDQNFRYWMNLQLMCSDDQMENLGFDFFCEVWMAVVETPEGLRVGYWSQGAY